MKIAKRITGMVMATVMDCHWRRVVSCRRLRTVTEKRCPLL